MAKDIQSWADIRETSIEIAEAIFEIADNDEAMAQKIWQEGSDEALEIAFAKTDHNKLFWGEEAVERKNV
ncbi:MAG TPA: YccJ family protein [Methyloradius sp.]